MRAIQMASGEPAKDGVTRLAGIGATPPDQAPAEIRTGPRFRSAVPIATAREILPHDGPAIGQPRRPAGSDGRGSPLQRAARRHLQQKQAAP